MAVSVQGSRQPIVQQEDPMDRILKGLQLASSVYGISQAGDKAKELLAEKEAKAKQQEFENQKSLVGGGMKLDPSGKVIVDEESAIFKKKTAERDTSFSDALKELQIENLKSKQGELGAAQTKQAGLYKSGKEAEAQYLEATSDKEKYDPTSLLQAARNIGPYATKSDLAKKAESAQSAWVESFLRDASGAAIAASERMNYAKDFFPRAGDTPEIIANKAALRKQKMETSKLGAGAKFEKMEAKEPPKVETKSINGVMYKKVSGGWEPM